MKQPKDLTSRAADVNHLPAITAGSIGFCPTWVLHVSLPNKVPNNPRRYTRNSGAYQLEIESDITVPYGSYARRILLFITTQSKKHRTRIIPIGKNISAVMKELGINRNGGNIKRFRHQMIAVLSSIFTFGYQGKLECMTVTKGDTALAKLLNDTWPDEITLSEEFLLNASRAVPIDLRIIKAFGDNCLILDIYCWLTHKFFTMSKKPIKIPIEYLKQQFGLNYKRNDQCQNHIVKSLEKLHLFYPEANYYFENKNLFLMQSPSHIAPKQVGT